MDEEQEPQFSDSEDNHRRVQIIISSNSATPVRQPEYQTLPIESEVQQFERVNPSNQIEDDEQRKKQQKINHAVAMMQQLQGDQEDAQAIKALRAKKKSKELERQAEKQIRKQFQKYPYLPLSSLHQVKNQLSRFQSTCKIEKLSPEEQIYAKLRQENRRLLTRAMLLAIEQLKVKATTNHTEVQQEMIGDSEHALRYCYKLSSEIENTFYRKLRNLKGKGQSYQKQIKLVLKEFNDKNNIEFRRNILNSRIDLKDLSTANEDSLKCQKTKEQQNARLLQLVRESEKDPFAEANPPEPEEQLSINFNTLPSVPSISSRMDVEQRQEDKEQIKIKQRNHLLQLYQACQQTIDICDQRRQERMRLFIQNHMRLPLFAEMCKRYNL